MNILVACHCKKQKLKITKFPLEGNILNQRIYKKYGIQKLDYVNIEGCDLFQEGWRILKPGGKIVVPSTNIDKKYEMMRFGYLVAQKPNPWLLSVKNIKDTEFQIDSPTHDFEESDYHIFIEKPRESKRYTRKRR
jgi:ubiquinone/menaquinone biosynthesis C-methylase UbiE